MGMNWNFRGYNPMNTEEASRASFIAKQKANMGGYVPQQTLESMQAVDQMGGYAPMKEDAPAVTPGVLMKNDPMTVNQQGGARVPMYERGALGQGYHYTQQQEQAEADRNALIEEYRNNQARIAEIEKELASITSADDDFDRRLAANRAEIGDMGNAQMHLGRIESRRAAEIGKDANTAKDRIAAEDEIDRLYISMADADPAQKEYLKRAIARKEDNYKATYGKPYGGELSIPVGATTGRATNKQEFTDKLRNFRNDKGNLTEEGKKILQSDIDMMPSGDMRNECQKLLDAEKTQENKDKGAAEQRKKEKDAIAQVKEDDTFSWKMSDGETKTVQANNGLSVTVTKKGFSTEYSCGKSRG